MRPTIKDLLHLEVAPALGCTEPVAVALAAAGAASLLPGPGFDRMRVRVSSNVFKNGLAVSIPGTGGLHGLDTAAALGALAGDPNRKLEVLAGVTPEAVADAREALARGAVDVGLLDQNGLRVEIELVRGTDTARCRIEGMHDHITALSLNGASATGNPLLADEEPGKPSGLPALEAWLKERPLEELVALTDGLDAEDLTFLEQGVEHNLRLAEYGLDHPCGLSVGRTLRALADRGSLARDMVLEARILSAAAADARMAGVDLPAMSSGGSGNHGLTAILPIVAVQRRIGADREALLRAVALSHVITAYVKAHTGRLSAVCGCSVAAGAGATAGATRLLGGSIPDMAGAIINLMEDLAGVVCDGAKAGCALKLATAAGTAVQAALLSREGVRVMPTDGIIGASAEGTMRNVGELSTHGMVEADRTIIGIMLKKRFAPWEEAQETQK